jgi:hypothetical protein
LGLEEISRVQARCGSWIFAEENGWGVCVVQEKVFCAAKSIAVCL